MAHSNNHGIKGIYFVDAVVDVNASVDGYDGKNTIQDFITANSPPIHIAYGYSEDNLPDDNNHDPKYGKAIVNVYEGLGIKGKATCVEGTGFENRYNYLLDFCSSVL